MFPISVFATEKIERLKVYRFVKSVEGKQVSLQQAKKLVESLASIGFSYPLDLKKKPPDIYVKPILKLDDNANGGVPAGSLEIGTLILHPEMHRISKSAVLAGAEMIIFNRTILGYGSFIDSLGKITSSKSMNASNFDVNRYSIDVCSKNHIGNWWFLDVCTVASEEHKKISFYHSKTVSGKILKLFETSDNSHHLVSGELSKHKFAKYAQNQFSFSFNSLYQKKISSQFNVSFGQNIKNQLALKTGIVAGVTLPIDYARGLSVGLYYQKFSGGFLLGFPRQDFHYGLEVTLPISKEVSISVANRVVDSSINYFDKNSQTLSINFSLLSI